MFWRSCKVQRSVSISHRPALSILACLLLSYGVIYIFSIIRSGRSRRSSLDEVELELHMDKEILSGDELLLKAAKRMRSLPLPPFITGEDNGRRFFANHTCARFPRLYHIHFTNTYWQTETTSNGTFYFYGAYYDNREMAKVGPVIRILSMIDRTDHIMAMHCQIWFQHEKAPAFSKVVRYDLIWHNHWGNGSFHPYLLTCQLPSRYHGLIPTSVSLVSKPCNPATNNLRIQYDRPQSKKGFAVCVKGLDYPHRDISVRLLEWLELLRLVGADKIFFYEFAVHPNVSKVLRHYESTGFVDVTPFTLPGWFPNDPFVRHVFLNTPSQTTSRRECEVIPYNDCLYRNLYKYEFIALLDIDEVIVPSSLFTNWTQLVETIETDFPDSRNCSSIVFRNVYFMEVMKPKDFWVEGVPKYFHMLQHVFRSSNYSGALANTKGFHRPERVLTLHNHFPMACLGRCGSHYTGTTLAQLNHYKPDCTRGIKKCNETFRSDYVIDVGVLRYEEKLVERVQRVLHELGFL